MTVRRADAVQDSEPAAATEPLLEVSDLRVEFEVGGNRLTAVNGVSLTVDAGQTHALLGESGSGKSVSAQAIMGLKQHRTTQHVSGSVRLRGREILGAPESELNRLRASSIALVSQSALAALNPVLTVGSQLVEIFQVHRGVRRAEARNLAAEVLDRVKIPGARSRLDDYPHQFSGGMRQRVVIATAIALEPHVLIADEPTTALDVTVQAQILDLLNEIKSESGMGVVLITHDMGLVAQHADVASVMYAGRIIDHGPTPDIFMRPRHPYTAGLVRSIPRVSGIGRPLHAIGGRTPGLGEIPPGCEFAPRCDMRTDICVAERPVAVTIDTDRSTACHHWKQVTR